MISNEKKLNHDLIVGWWIIVFVLFAAYCIEILKGGRDFAYVILFMLVTGIPALVCWLIYKKNPLSHHLRYMVVAGYFIMYTFVLQSARTPLVFTYIFPLLALLILYHQPKLILYTGIATLLLNAFFICFNINNPTSTFQNGYEIEIEIALLTLCFGGSYWASKLYDDTHKDNELHIALLDEKSKEIQTMTLQTIETIANTIDAKDEYTQGHSRRVSDYAAQIAKRMHMSDEEVMKIRYVALLHDIGKIGVPDSVLNKPGRLTDAEYELMKKHTIIGGDILKDIETLQDLNVGAKFHHERYDGKGYPNGLKGEEIPIIARIICIADAYDAMTSNRIYRKHISKNVVLEELKRCRGTQFDPAITDTFLDYLKESVPDENDFEDEQNASFAIASNKLLQKIVRDANQQTIKNAEEDNLTTVYNRSVGERKVTFSILNSKGFLMLINIDNMRQINHQYGFRRGDYYLQTVAQMLKQLNESIIITRFSGDEFMCYIPDITDMSEIETLITNFINDVHTYQQENHLLSKFSVSIGITIHDKDNEELSQLLMRADKALYHVKQDKKDGYYFYRQVKELKEEISNADIKYLIDTIRQKDNFSEDTVLAHDEFSRMYQFILDISNTIDHSIQLILFTALPKNNHDMGIEEREQVMYILERAILNTMKDETSIMQYSSIQRIIMLVGEDEKDIHNIAENIFKDFYKMYDKNDIELYYDIASIN